MQKLPSLFSSPQFGHFHPCVSILLHPQFLQNLASASFSALHFGHIFFYKDILIENNPKEFAESLNKLIVDKEKRYIISSNGKRVIQKHYFKGYNSEVLKSILIK